MKTKRTITRLASFKDQIKWAAVVFGIAFMSSYLFAGDKRPAEKEAKHPMKTDTITIPTLLLDHLLSESDLHGWLGYLPSLDVEDERKVYPAYAVAERTAKEAQRAASSKGAEKIKIRVDQTITIRGLGEEAIESCVTVFAKNLPRAISKNDQKVLMVWARKCLTANFSETFTIQLQKDVRTLSPDGKTGFGFAIRSSSDRHTPVHLRGYYFIIHRLKDGKPAVGTETGSPWQTKEGKRYDFLTIETEDEAAKPAAEKPGESPKKEKSR